MESAQIKAHLRSLKLPAAVEQLDRLLMEAEEKGYTNQEFLDRLLSHELAYREDKRLEKYLKLASFPEYKPLSEFDLTEQQALSPKQWSQLQELHWLEQTYNLILLGPPGIGKTHMAIGLGIEAIRRGYRVQFITMDELIRVLKTQEVMRTARSKVKRMTEADLVVIDDLMFMAIDRHEANLFFQLINKLYGQSSIIIFKSDAFWLLKKYRFKSLDSSRGIG